MVKPLTVRVDESQVAEVALVQFGIQTLQEADLPASGLLEDAEGAPIASVIGSRLELRQPLRWTHPASVRAELAARRWSEVHAVLGDEPPGQLPAARPLMALVPAVGRPDDGAVTRRLRAWRGLAADHDDILVVPVPLRADRLPALGQRAARAYGATSHEFVAGDGGRRCSGGLTVFFTGLSGAGKSTIARLLVEHLSLRTSRTLTLLDGDVVRGHLSKGLGFSREDRDTNVLRIGWVAAEITKHGGVAVCAPIAPYATTRAAVRRMVEDQGGVGSFVLVHVDTPLSECERRDRKGLYAMARRGELASFTGITDVYERPEDAHIVVSTECSVEESTLDVLHALQGLGVLVVA